MRKDVRVTVRMARATRRRLAALAAREGRSLSEQVVRLIDVGLGFEKTRTRHVPEERRLLAGVLARKRVPEYEDFREVRTLLSASLLRTR